MQVHLKFIVGGLVLLLSTGALAQGGGQEDLAYIAKQSGLTVRQVQMILGEGAAAFPEYRTYALSERKLHRAVLDGRIRIPVWTRAAVAKRLSKPQHQQVEVKPAIEVATAAEEG